MNIKRHTLTVTGTIIVALITLFSAWAAENDPKKAAQKPAAAPSNPTAQPAAAQPNAIARAAAIAGVPKCVGRIGQITDFVTANTQSSGLLFTAPSAQNSRISSASLEVSTSDTLTYVGTSFAPGPSANECSGLYEAVTYWQNRCDDVGAKAFGSFKRITPLGRVIAMLDGGPGVRVFLMPAGQGCISIKKEMIYQ